MKISLIAAMGRNRVIGTGEEIPWNLPRDQKFFRQYTQGKHLLIGRKTYEEMQGWFSDQTPIVLTSREDYEVEHSYSDVASAISAARKMGAPELVVCGGAKTYAATLGEVQEMYITLVDGNFDGESRFPDYEEADWQVVSREHFPADAENSHAMTFLRLERRRDS